MTKEAYKFALNNIKHLNSQYHEVARRYIKLRYDNYVDDRDSISVSDDGEYFYIDNEYLYYKYIPIDYMWEPESTFESRVLQERKEEEDQKAKDEAERQKNEDARLYEEFLKLKEKFEH